MKSLASTVSKVAAPILGRKGLGETQIITDWSAIMGSDLARDSLPVKLSFGPGERIDGTLHLRVAPGAALAIQHLTPVIIERINGFFGYKAVGRLALRQGPLPGRTLPRAAPLRPLVPAEAADLTARLAGIEDPELRAAFERLGRAVIGSAPLP
jgi:hypothetical protein